MVSVQVLILEYICPALGMIAANIMFAAPFKDLKKAIKKGDLGDLNPTPWAFMLGNCLGWVTYAFLLRNPWVFFGNCPGLLMSIWFNLGAVKLSYHKYHAQEMRESVVQLLVNEGNSGSFLISRSDQEMTPNDAVSTTSGALEIKDEEKGDEEMIKVNSTFKHEGQTKTPSQLAQLVLDVTSQKMPAPAPHENLIMAISFIWVVCISVICLVPGISLKARQLTVASLVNGNLVFFYGAPLSTIYTVTRLRDSSSIHVRTMITNTFNGAFWTAYGLAISDYFIAVPNSLGALFGVIQIVLCILFPRKQQSSDR